MVGLILTLGLAGTLHARVTLGNELRGQLVQRGTTAASGISSRSEEALLTNDVFALYEMINAAVINDQDVHYVFITDSSAALLTHAYRLRDLVVEPPRLVVDLRAVVAPHGTPP